MSEKFQAVVIGGGPQSSIYNFQHAKVTQIIPTENPRRTPFALPK